MKRKMLVICSSVALLHLVVGGAVILGGCTGVDEDEPMPTGAFVPNTPVSSNEEFPVPGDQPGLPVATTAPANGEPAMVPESVLPENEPAPEAVPVPPMKGDSATPAKAADRPEDISYTVQKGDSYWKIAQMYSISTAELVAYNSIAPEKLRPGQKIQIPASGKKIEVKKSSAAPAKHTSAAHAEKKSVSSSSKHQAIPADGTYAVQKGDSFYKIAQKFGVKASDIAAANNLPLTQMLQIDQKLKIPAPGVTVKASNVKSTKTGKNNEKSAAPAAGESLVPPPIDAPALPDAPAIPAEGSEPAAAPAVPAADALPAAPSTDAAPALPDAPAAEAAPAAPAAGFSTVIKEDSTVEEVAQRFATTAEQLRALNPGIPADGTIKANTVVKMP